MTRDEFILDKLNSGRISVDLSNGDIYSIASGTPYKLKPYYSTGYVMVTIHENKTKKNVRVHRVVWIAANGVPPEDMDVDHINDIKTDNRLENLQLLPRIENSAKGARYWHNYAKQRVLCGEVQHSERLSGYQYERKWKRSNAEAALDI